MNIYISSVEKKKNETSVAEIVKKAITNSEYIKNENS